ncbi:MAG: hypothetical protein ACYC2R_10340 [Burkholderiales bacterium]|nr:hypothetical protein [Sulfuricellaceae bacterium]
MDMRAFIQAETLIQRFRKTIPTSTQTARSIDRNDSWNKVVAFARDEGYSDIAAQLEVIWREYMTDEPE